MTLSTQLLETRKRLGLNQADMAAALRICKRMYCYYEQGQKVPPAAPQVLTLETLQSRVAALEVACKAIAADEQHACDYANGLTPFCIFPA